MRGTVHNPVIQDGKVDCPKDGCGGEISLKEKTCGRCSTRITRLYKHRRIVIRMTYRINHNGHKANSFD